MGLAGMAGGAAAAPGYGIDSGSSVVRTGFGECLHTPRWSMDIAIPACEGKTAAVEEAPKKAAVAAVETKTVIRKQLKPIRLQADALFEFDSAKLTDAGRAELNRVVASIPRGQLENQQINITGHTDRLGPSEYNEKLSMKRANAVRDYLVAKGMSADRIATSGLGESRPLVDCEGKRGKRLVDCLAPNRRTVIEFSAMEVIEVKETVPVDTP
jgi:OOP family OmpA-OmpF porin